MTIMKKAALAAAASLLLATGGIATAGTASAATSISCAGHEYEQGGAPFKPSESDKHFGFYNGYTDTPSPSTFSWTTVEAQCLLNTIGSNLTVDGYYGPKTQDALRVVQREESLTPDGFVGPDTWPVLRFVAN
ncbi:peptidoglycan-binding domain-containing protein [Kitasatospora sp. NPDC089797]|uniref:peptidoglycan-binding domain-containing protein n=1 Tax=Kitasatospora sp. NPDC089797 TaxID=3155298 RepID=UPI003413EE50